MPIQPTYPGVYIEEIPSGVRTITGVATSIAAFIGYFKKGPMNEAVQIFNMSDFERIFGGLEALSEASYAIQQFFWNGGSQAYVIRVASGDPQASAVTLYNSDNEMAFKVEAINEGSWGNHIRVTIDYDSTQTDEFNMTITEYAPSTQQVVRQEIFRNLSLDSSKNNTVDKVINDKNTGSKIVNIPEDAVGEGKTPIVNGTLSGEHTDDQSISISGLEFVVTISSNTIPESHEATLVLKDLEAGQTGYPLTTLASALETAVRTAAPSNPLFADATVDIIDNKLHVRVGGDEPSSRITFENKTGSTLADDLLLSNLHAASNEHAFSLEGGDDGSLPNGLAFFGNQTKKTGIYALEDVDIFNILCIPRTAMTSGTNAMNEQDAQSVITFAASYCEKKRAFFIIDTPIGIKDLPAIKAWIKDKASIRHKNAALYYPRIYIPDPLNNSRLRSIGACGTIAGLYARTDSERGIWKAPAGTEASLRNAPELTDILSDQENGVLNQLGVNCLRNFSIYGNISWGARTLMGADQIASEWKYIPVRRLASFLEESLFRGTKWVVFEPNDEPLWSQIRLNVGAFMNNLFKQGAFQGTSPKEAYFVKCDSETTTQHDINQGIVNILVGFAPLKPAEFVFIKVQQLAGQIQS
jgi:phage tail sheath protein FI